MANRRQRAIKVALRKAGDYFHGQTCDARKLRAEAGRKPRDEGRKLRALSDKRVLDKRITNYASGKIYA